MYRTLLAVLCFVLLGFVAGVRGADNEAKAIITKAVKAHGGEEALLKYKGAQAKNKGKLKLPGLGEVEIIQEIAVMQPDKFKEVVEFEIMNQKVRVETVVNGDKASIEANGKAVPLTDDIKKTLKEAQYTIKAARLAALVKDKGYDFESLGEIKVDGKPALGVRITSKGHKDINMYFNKETGLLAKVESRSSDPTTGKEFTEERIIMSYGEKGKEGIPVAKKVVVKHDGELFLEAEVVEYKLLEKIDDSEFTKE
jgi:hypothetical protein